MKNFTRGSELRALESATNEERHMVLQAKKAAFTKGLSPEGLSDRKEIFAKKNPEQFAAFYTSKKFRRP